MIRTFYPHLRLRHYCGSFYYLNSQLITVRSNPRYFDFNLYYPLYMTIRDVDALIYFENNRIVVTDRSTRLSIKATTKTTFSIQSTKYYIDGIGRLVHRIIPSVDCDIENVVFLIEQLLSK